MSLRELKLLIQGDLYRYHGRVGTWLALRELILGVGFKYSFWFRLESYFCERCYLWLPVHLLTRLMLRRYMFRFGISIPRGTRVGVGLYIGHFGGIFVSSEATIGKNCNLSQDVTIGASNRGERRGAPVIGDNVYIGPGAKIFGRIVVGNHVAIGANCVVTRDVPEYGVVVGVPGRVISSTGSRGYVCNTDYAGVQSNLRSA